MGHVKIMHAELWEEHPSFRGTGPPGATTEKATNSWESQQLGLADWSAVCH